MFVAALFMQLLTLCFDVGDSLYNLAIAPEVLGIAAAAGGSLIGNILNRDNARKQVKLQKDLMDYQWNKFSSPKAQLDSYAQAGLNPSVVYGQGGLSTAQPNVSAPALSQFDVGLSGQDLTGSILALAQAKKAGSDAAGVNLDNLVKQQTLDDQIKSVALRNKWTAEDTARITQSVGTMSAQYQLMQQQIDNLKSEKHLTDEQVNWYGKEMRAKIADLQSSADYKDAIKGLNESQKQLLDCSMDSLVQINNLNKDLLSQSLTLLNRYGDAQAVVGLLGQLVGSASDLIGSIAGLKNVNKVVETVTGSTTRKVTK